MMRVESPEQWIKALCVLFHEARGNAEQRILIKNQLSEAASYFAVTWAIVKDWFREVCAEVEQRLMIETSLSCHRHQYLIHVHHR